MPNSVTATGGLYELKGKITTPDVLTASFEFARCPVTWRHRIWGAEEYTPAVANGIFFYGDKQTIFVTDDRWEVIPRGKAKEREVNEVKTDAGLRHVTEFLNAVRERKPAGCLVEDAYASTASVQLAMISYETGTKVDWDAKSERILNNPAASELLKRSYREPYKHPFAG
jgi:predicted dehydrogenase